MQGFYTHVSPLLQYLCCLESMWVGYLYVHDTITNCCQWYYSTVAVLLVVVAVCCQRGGLQAAAVGQISATKTEEE